jgi:Cof subfamily protein (haloacid dehalogenase superfamily)
MNPRHLKALAFDLDGTLLTPGAVLTERTIRAVRSCAEKGLETIIVTGRAIEAAEKFRTALGAAGPVVYFNGALVMDMPGGLSAGAGKILHTALLNTGAVDFCIDLSRKRGVYFQVYFPEDQERFGSFLMAEKKSSERDMYFRHTGVLARIGNLKEALGGPGKGGCIKGMFLAEPPVQDVLRPEIEEGLGKSVYIARTKTTYLEVMNAGTSKGEGLSVALERRGIKPGETLAFGDEENDLPLFRAAGFSAAPANAKDAIKAAADFITASNAEDGVAAFLEETFL